MSEYEWKAKKKSAIRSSARDTGGRQATAYGMLQTHMP